MNVRRVLVVALSAFVAVNIWTGAPLLALWVGSRLVSRISLSMSAVAIVIGVLAATIYLMAMLLVRLDNAYRRLTSTQQERHQPGWLSPLADAHLDPRSRPRLTGVERVVVISVQLAVISLLVWFFFIAGSPLPH